MRPKPAPPFFKDISFPSLFSFKKNKKKHENLFYDLFGIGSVDTIKDRHINGHSFLVSFARVYALDTSLL